MEFQKAREYFQSRRNEKVVAVGRFVKTKELKNKIKLFRAERYIQNSQREEALIS